MELLPHFGVSGELSKEEFVRRLGRECTAVQVRELRLSLFKDAVRKDLADIGDELVQRKKMGGGRTVKEKHMDDSWLLVGAIKRCECVLRILLKNGKRARNDLLRSQAKLRVASYPGSRWAGKERAWYPLFAHALNFPEILGNRKLLCYIRKTVTT